MISSNVECIKFLLSKGLYAVRRIVRNPRKWTEIVELAKSRGHTSLTEDKVDVKALQTWLEGEGKILDPFDYKVSGRARQKTKTSESRLLIYYFFY